MVKEGKHMPNKNVKPEPKPIAKQVKEVPVVLEEEKPKSASEMYKELLEQAEQLKATAVSDLKADIATKILELNSYGYSYRLAENQQYSLTSNSTETHRKRRTPTTIKGPSSRYDPSQFCSVCGIKGHNTRAHNLHKAIFTPEELSAKGWQVPAQTAAN